MDDNFEAGLTELAAKLRTCNIGRNAGTAGFLLRARDRMATLDARWKSDHEERQQLRGILYIPPPTDGGTTTAEFGAQPQLVDAAKQIVARLATLREFVRRVREIDATVTQNTTVSLYRAIQWLDAELAKKVSE